MGNTDVRRLVEIEAQAILNIPSDNHYDRVVRLITDALVIKGKIITTGVGKCKYSAEYLAALLNSIDIPTVFLDPCNAHHGDFGIVNTPDVIIIFSNSGKTIEVLEILALAKSKNSNIHIVAITGTKDSSLDRRATYSLFTGPTQEVDPFTVIPTTSITVMNIISHILLVKLIEKTGTTLKDYYKNHPKNLLDKFKLQL